MPQKIHDKDSLFTMFKMVFVCLLLISTTFVIYWQVKDFEFVSYDDRKYIYENKYVSSGVTLDGITWAFTSIHASNWHPLTWISHMVDCELFGLKSGWHHLINVFFHFINSMVLFFVLKRMTGAIWRSAFVALLFAVHPLHIESVAWVAERKDVLSTFLGFLTIWFYLLYVERQGFQRYVLMLFFFALSLMSKPMLVTLPLLLLLLDFWPLNRFGLTHLEKYTLTSLIKRIKETGTFGLLAEKIPLFALVAASCIITFYAQKSGDSMASLHSIPLDLRFQNALVSYIGYIWKMIWPFDLACLYPYPEILPVWKVLGAGLLFLFITSAAFLCVKKYRFLTVGWLWYLITLVPVIGFVQVGIQSMADRYTYVPLIGIFIMVVWAIAELISQKRIVKFGVIITAAILILFLIKQSFIQTQYWQNSKTLFEHALEVTNNNFLMHNNLGNILLLQGKTQQAINHYQESLRINPTYYNAHSNLGYIYTKQGMMNKAIYHLSEAIQINPYHAKAHLNLGNAFFAENRLDKAIKHYKQAIRLAPEIEQAQIKLKNMLNRKEKIDESITKIENSLKNDTDNLKLLHNLAVLYSSKGDYDIAINYLHKMRELDSDNADIYYNIACIYAKQNEIDKSVEWLEKAVKKGFNDWNLLKNDNDLVNIRNTSFFRKLLKSISFTD